MGWFFEYCNFAFRTTLKMFADYSVEGRENVPRTGPLIIVSNHLSTMDPPLVAAACGRNPAFMAKKELFSVPPFAFFLRQYGAFPVDRQGGDMRALNWAISQVKARERALVLFPEGTRSRDLQLKQGHRGVAHIAITAGVPIVPVGVAGSQVLQNALRVFMPSAQIRVRIGKSFRVKPEIRRAGRDQLSAITDEIMIRIAQLLPESRRGYYSEMLDRPMENTVDASPLQQVDVTA